MKLNYLMIGLAIGTLVFFQKSFAESSSPNVKNQANFAQVLTNQKVVIADDQPTSIKFTSLKAKGWKLLPNGKLIALKKGHLIVTSVIEAFSPKLQFFVNNGVVQVELKQNGMTLPQFIGSHFFSSPSQKATIKSFSFIDIKKGDEITFLLKGTPHFGIKSLNNSCKAPTGSSANLTLYDIQGSTKEHACFFNQLTFADKCHPQVIPFTITTFQGEAFKLSKNGKTWTAEKTGKYFISYYVQAFSPSTPLFPEDGGIVDIWINHNGKKVQHSKKRASLAFANTSARIYTQALLKVRKGDKIKFLASGTPHFTISSSPGTHSASVMIEKLESL